MMGYNVYFDIARGLRIGFAESNCDYMSLVLSEGTSLSNPIPDIESTNIEVIEEENMDEAAAKEVVETAVLDINDNDGGDVADELAAETEIEISDKADPDRSEEEKKAVLETPVLENNNSDGGNVANEPAAETNPNKSGPYQSEEEKAAVRTTVLENNDSDGGDVDNDSD